MLADLVSDKSLLPGLQVPDFLLLLHIMAKRKKEGDRLGEHSRISPIGRDSLPIGTPNIEVEIARKPV